MPGREDDEADGHSGTLSRTGTGPVARIVPDLPWFPVVRRGRRPSALGA